MARPLRIEIPDGVYHVTSRGLERRAIVRDDADRARWTDLLDRVARRRQWRVLAWALMSNHFHLFLRTPGGDLSAGMHDLNAGYVSWFNHRHERCGPLLQGRFKAVLVERQYHYWELTRYVHLNPVRAGLVADPAEYAWGSCRCYFRPALAPEWLAWEEVLAEHGRTMRTAQQAYRRFLSEGIERAPTSPLKDTVASTLLGTSGFVERMKQWLEDRLPDRDVPAARELQRDIAIEDIERAVCRHYGVGREALSERGRHGNDARTVAIYLSRTLTRMPVGTLGERFGGVAAPAVSNVVRQMARRRAGSRRLDALLGELERTITEAET